MTSASACVVVVDGSGEASHDLVLPSTLPLVPLATQAMMFDLSSGFAVTTTNAIEGPIVPLSAWSDSFDGTELDASWSIYNSHLLDYSVSGGELHLRPTQSGPPVTWYADGDRAWIDILDRDRAGAELGPGTDVDAWDGGAGPHSVE